MIGRVGHVGVSRVGHVGIDHVNVFVGVSMLGATRVFVCCC